MTLHFKEDDLKDEEAAPEERKHWWQSRWVHSLLIWVPILFSACLFIVGIVSRHLLQRPGACHLPVPPCAMRAGRCCIRDIHMRFLWPGSQC